MDDDFEANIDNYVKNHAEYQIYKQDDDDDKLVPDNWQEIADMRLKMLENEYLSVLPSSAQNVVQGILFYKFTQIYFVFEFYSFDLENDTQIDEEGKENAEVQENNNINDEQLDDINSNNINPKSGNSDDEDEFGEFQDGNYWMLNSDEENSDHSHSDNETDLKQTTKTSNISDLPKSQNDVADSLNNDLGKSQDFDLSEEKVEKIKKAMSKLSLTPPPWERN